MASQCYLGRTWKTLRSLLHQMHWAPGDVGPIIATPGCNSDGPHAGLEAIHITIKEFIPVVMAAAVCDLEWSGRLVCIQCNNAAVVAIVNSGMSRDQDTMHLMKCLAFIMAKFNFLLFASYMRMT